jgi:hypothetical protein
MRLSLCSPAQTLVSSGLPMEKWLIIQKIGSQIAEGKILFCSIEKISNMIIANATK